MPDTDNVRIITTGGTLDKIYQWRDGSLGFGTTLVREQLTIAHSNCPITELMAIDSLDMTDDHRQQLLACCRACPESRLVITHGTDTMVETAAAIQAASLNKTIVLTGAMVPLSVNGSDGPFNLGFALGIARVLGNGVWVAMNGAARPWNNVRKDRSKGIFTSAPN